MSDRLVWETDGADWPNRQASRFVVASGFRWHVQEAGSGPTLVLVHGTGASTHSWRRLLPRLAETFTVIAADLPGHGFTDTPESVQQSLPGMAAAVAALLRELRVEPDLVVGHSAGAAIVIRMALDERIAPRAILSLNGALLPFQGAAGQFFSPLAKLLVLNPFMPRIFAWRAGDRSAVERLIRGTGSTIEATDIDLYARIFRSPAHIAGTLAMMAHWDLDAFAKDLPRLKTPLALAAGSVDQTVVPETAFKVRDLIPTARVELLRGLGHLPQEEDPEAVFRLILSAARRSGTLSE